MEHPTRYTGKVCAKHPELEGLRRKNSRSCVVCHYEMIKASKKRKRDEIRKMAAAVGVPIVNPAESGPHHYGKVCDKHPELKGARRKDYYCVQCNRDRQEKWRALHPEQQKVFAGQTSKNRKYKETGIRAAYLKLVVNKA